MGDSYDLDAALAERTARPAFTFRFGGRIFTLPPEPDVIGLSLLVEGQQPLQGLRRVMGEEQFKQLQALPVTFGPEALNLLIGAYSAHAGIDLGELSASPTSSSSMARPSKPTSNGSTRSRSRRSVPAS